MHRTKVYLIFLLIVLFSCPENKITENLDTPQISFSVAKWYNNRSSAITINHDKPCSERPELAKILRRNLH